MLKILEVYPEQTLIQIQMTSSLSDERSSKLFKMEDFGRSQNKDVTSDRKWVPDCKVTLQGLPRVHQADHTVGVDQVISD